MHLTVQKCIIKDKSPWKYAESFKTTVYLLVQNDVLMLSFPWIIQLT